MNDPAAIVTAVCELISKGVLVKDACKKVGISRKQLFHYTRDNADLGNAYARAREEQAHAIAEDAISIADSRAGSPEAVGRNKLRVDARKWMASKIAPRTYGDKLELAGDPDRPLQVQVWQFGERKVTF